MFFIKKFILGLTALALIFIGGSGTQSNNLLMQGGGFVGIVIGLVVLYLFGKMVWRAMGCLPSFFIICVVAAFIMYAIGAFRGGIGNIVPNVLSFLGQGNAFSGYSEQQSNAALQLVEPEKVTPLISENFNDISMVPTASVVPEGCPPANCPPEVIQAVIQQAAQAPIQQPQPAQQPAQQNEGGIVQVIVDTITGSKLVNGQGSAPAQNRGDFNPMNYPAVYGVANVINGDTINLGNRYVKLYGVVAPISNQTCADSRGRSYACGQESARWLKRWISGQEIECRVLHQDSRGNIVGVCMIGQYDIAAALVNAGWAVANTKTTNIYVPYQQQAQENLRGLWQGQFYMPWDWKDIQSKKPKIKVIRPKTKKSILDF
jgi:endonuclease YncB( thermonuclease family)